MTSAMGRPMAGFVADDGAGQPIVMSFRKMWRFRHGLVSSTVSMGLLRGSDGTAERFICCAIPVLPPPESNTHGHEHGHEHPPDRG